VFSQVRRVVKDDAPSDSISEIPSPPAVEPGAPPTKKIEFEPWT
jgi:hypothetical protein